MRGFTVVGLPAAMRGLGELGRMGYRSRGGRHSPADPDLLEAWLASRESSKRRDTKDLAVLAKTSLQHAVDAEVERFEEHLTTDLRPPIDYVEASDGSVVKGTRRVSQLVLEVAASDLNIVIPELRWFRAAIEGETPEFSSPPINGLADRETGIVWLSDALSPFAVATTCAHEVAHLAGRGELDAQLYAANYDVRK